MDLSQWKAYLWPFALFVLAVVFLLFALIFGRSVSVTGTDPVLSVSEDRGEGEAFYVDIEGAVVKPGVYQFKEADLVVQALEMAGGLRSEADFNWVAQNINRAQKLNPESKLYIPFRTGTGVPGDSKNIENTTAKININKASLSELETLVGIGEKTAEKIIAGRPYKAVTDLLERKILSSSLFESIKAELTVY